MYLLDTNHCSEIIKNNPDICLILDQRRERDSGISIIVYGELLYMAEKSEHKSHNRQLIHDFIEQIALYFIDENTCILYSQLKVALFEYFAPYTAKFRLR